MDKGNKGWWEFPRWSDVYEQGTDEYIKKAFATRSQGNQISCPCSTCRHRYWYGRNDIRDQIICNGFVPRNDESFDLGTMAQEGEVGDLQLDEPSNMNDGVQELLHDTLREGPNEEAKKFLKLIEEGQQELYPGCKKMSRLAFTIRLYIYKCDHKLSDVAIAGLLEFFKEVLPDDAILPTSMHETKKVLKLLGLDYKRIDACPKDCMLYWAEHANATSCYVCGTSRWKSKKNDSDDDSNKKTHRIPSKVLRYFPIKKRLQRLYMCAETASYMTWYKTGREKDGLLQHPVDGQAWINFDKLYPNFSNEPRNVRLALATDGFNPFNTMSIVHSTWPVILISYNLPPWLATKSEFLMLSLLIPGPLSPGNAIDVYLQPLIKDLIDLWEVGMETYDASTNTRFDMHVALVGTISDFPAYAMVSGWSTKGKFACPYCHYEIDSVYLKYSRKHCYMCHRKWLDSNHPWRYNKRNFNGHIEERNEPVRLTGGDIEDLLRDFPNGFGKEQPKMKQNVDDPNPWRKLSILFKLPYWKNCDLRHNLDPMHIEKNMFDNVIATLLDIPGKTKDHVSAHRDLKFLREKFDLRWVPELEGQELEDGSEEFPAAMFSMNDDEKKLFCQTIKNAKLPQGYASNISRCVEVNEKKITGYKSHDAHFMMHYLLPIAAKTTLNNVVAAPIIRLANFFKGIWKKTIDPKDLDNLHSEIVETLCQFEGIFPPAFFDIMVHLPVHLVEEIKLGGPVAIRCMYAIERYLRELKSDARNKGRPEASMAEGFLAKECARFVVRYLSKSKKQSRGHVDHPDKSSTSQEYLPKSGHPIKGRGKTSKKERGGFMIDHTTWSQAHQYVLFNCDCKEVERYINEHKEQVGSQRKRKWDSAQSHSKEFKDWFKETIASKLHQGQEVLDHVKWLSMGPSFVAKKYSGYFVNGYRFYTMERERNYVTQNSGVCLSALTHSFASSKDKNPTMGNVMYYGSVEEIIEISYQGYIDVVLFRCVWFHSETTDDNLTMVNKNKRISNEEPFIMASQAQQVFYVESPTDGGWHYAMHNFPLELSDGSIKFPLFHIMKRNSKKVAAQKMKVTEYEKQRLETISKNLEHMRAMGLGALAEKVFQIKAEKVLENACDNSFSSDDEEYIPHCEAEDDENVTSSKIPIAKKTLKCPSSKRKCMSDYLPTQQEKEEPQNEQQKGTKLHGQQPHHQGPNQQQNGQSKLPNQQQKQPNQQQKQPNQQQNQPNQQNRPNQEQNQQQNGHAQPEQKEPNHQKKMPAKYCSPGTMSSFLNLRRKQLQEASRGAKEGHESIAENEGHDRASNEANEGLAACHDAATNNSIGLQLQQSLQVEQSCDASIEVEPQKTNTTAQSSAPKKKEGSRAHFINSCS